MADFDEITEYLNFLEGMKMVDIIHDSDAFNIDAELNDPERRLNSDIRDVQYIYGTEEFSPYEEVHEFYVGNEFNNENTSVDIVQCIFNMIELEHVLNNDDEECKIRCRRWGVHPINQMRREQGHFENLITEMLLYDPEKFFNYTRMSPDRFDYLLALIGPKITKTAPNAIPAKCRLLITLRYLATGDSVVSVHYAFRVGVSTAYSIIYETCDALWNVLAPIYLKYPTEEDWLRISKEFEDLLHLPHCCGALDGKHVEIVAPKHSGSMYYNYLNYFSTCLLALSDARKNFIYVDIGAYGSQSDGGVLFNSTFGQRLDTNNLQLPPPDFLPHTTQPFPFFIIGDAAFPLHENILTPYPKNCQKEEEVNYNDEHSSVRKVIENIFAILVKRWQILSGPISADPENVDRIVRATVVLHNFVKSFDDVGSARYMRAEREDKVSTNQGLLSFYESGLVYDTSNASSKAHMARDIYASYLNNIN